MMRLFSTIFFTAFLGMSSYCSCLEWDQANSYMIGNQKYLKDRLSNSDKRFTAFILALEMLQQRNSQILVETGTARGGDHNFIGDGGSTIIFGNWATEHDAILFSVDLDPLAILQAQAPTEAYKENIQFVCQDSIEYLKNFSQPIDFLYLDSFDFEIGNPIPSQQHHLKELEAAYPKLHKNSIVMIDDCALPDDGKGKLVIDYLLERGWKVAFNGYQVILVQ